MNQNKVLNRVKVEGKDSLDQHTNEIMQYMRDVCRQITTAHPYLWLLSEETITTTGTWQALDKDIKQIKGAETSDLKINPISEEQYYFRKNQVTTESKAYYRTRWNTSKRLWEINFINVDASTSINLLVRRIYNDVTKLPDELEEAVVEGTLAKYYMFLEGDDSRIADKHQANYVALVRQDYHLLSAETQDDENDRVLTNDEIENARYGFYEDTT